MNVNKVSTTRGRYFESNELYCGSSRGRDHNKRRWYTVYPLKEKVLFSCIVKVIIK